MSAIAARISGWSTVNNDNYDKTFQRVNCDLEKNNKAYCNFTGLEEVIGHFYRRPWEKAFMRLMRENGVEYAYVTTKIQEEKFYAVVEDNSVEKMLALAELYNNFLEEYKKYIKTPYFDFVVFGKDEIDETDFTSDLMMIR